MVFYFVIFIVFVREIPYIINVTTKENIMTFAILIAIAYAGFVIYIRKNLPADFFKFNNKDQ